MCLITFAYRSHPVYSLILLANRDEFYQRPTQAMMFWQDQPDILAGRDLEQGGTWLGLNRNGQFATVTNFRDGRQPPSGLKSRGNLTARFLSNKLTADAYLQELMPDQANFNAFNLLLGDEQGLYYCSNQGATPQSLCPGVYGLSNALLDSPWPKLLQVREGLQTLIDSKWINTDSLLALMHNPEQAADNLLPDTGISYNWEKRLSACFIRSPDYGTRATTLILQKYGGETYICEQSFDAQGTGEKAEYQLMLPAIGSTA
ncbi:MAG: NRDE family protein [Pontibacterium sp.]